ncbi:vacuolar protein sorting-associated protein 32 homolog 1-like isoform X2 [Aristolochia californica]|uniref:vacuolar protein sorting-associated protein 32 homolog 1-like isoform X2 n=1 Tax=Aristolochia californica TaxID=171875 RepID=UPI0035D5A00F
MFTALFRSCAQGDTPPAALQLKQTMKMLEEKENVLQKKISIENERFKEFTKSKNKQSAVQCLKRRKFYEDQLHLVASFQTRVNDQEEKLPETRATHSGDLKQIKSNLKGSSGKNKIRSSKS